MISANIDRKTRKLVYERDHYRCAICDSDRAIQIHHAIARSAGGHPTDPMNLGTLCMVCHANAHGDMLPEDFTQEGTELAIVEYLADYYAPNWWPWRPGYHPGGFNPRAGGG